MHLVRCVNSFLTPALPCLPPSSKSYRSPCSSSSHTRPSVALGRWSRCVCAVCGICVDVDVLACLHGLVRIAWEGRS